MQFGKIPNFETVDFALPKDHEDNAGILKSSNGKGSIHIGCAKWGREDWVGKLYPKGTKATNFLDEYAKHFSSIEMNATHYRVFPQSTIVKWKEKVGDNFKFCPKFPQFISHIKRLKDVDRMTDEFLQSTYAFGKTLGPYFLQLHHTFSPREISSIENYLARLPEDIEVFLEVRDPKWFADQQAFNDLSTMLKEKRVGAVITDTSGRRDCAHMRLSTPSTFIRFVGNSLHPTDYDRIDDWVQRIKNWLEQGIETVWFFMHQHEELHSPELCAYLVEQLNKHCGTKLEPPKLLSKETTLFD
ncbi:MAG: hypothetical protein COA57_10705 [Flavobacteriales bacterium]|nr:MAG: hypothetical protein COA57_10705 [Flavobacteriales bacterium]